MILKTSNVRLPKGRSSPRSYQSRCIGQCTYPHRQAFLLSTDPVITEVTFLRNTFFCIELHHSKMTGFNTSLASGYVEFVNLPAL
jgi:hypothetical protein